MNNVSTNTSESGGWGKRRRRKNVEADVGNWLEGRETAAWDGGWGWREGGKGKISEPFAWRRIFHFLHRSDLSRSTGRGTNTLRTLLRNRKSAEWKKEIKPSPTTVVCEKQTKRKAKANFLIFQDWAALRHTWASLFSAMTMAVVARAVAFSNLDVPRLGPSQKLELKSHKSN